MDFADALHLASSQQLKKFYTFDKKFQQGWVVATAATHQDNCKKHNPCYVNI
jgi:predicted nucleic acid-binding protein